MTRRLLPLLFMLLLGLMPLMPVQAQGKGPLVLAASSLQEVLTAAADQWVRHGHPRPVLAFAASSALARQIEAGAKADLFISADVQWMDYVAQRRAILPAARTVLIANRLVLIAHADRPQRLDPRNGAQWAKALGKGRLAMADPDSVPAGRYGKAALETFGLWSRLSHRIARADTVRAALALVERGLTPLGIVYATDARASPKVMIAATFPANSHPPITYLMARLSRSTHADSEAFRRFLLSAEGRAIFLRHGFVAP